MTETQHESVPREDASEPEAALAFLRFARRCVLKKTDGLDEMSRRRALVPSGTSLIGLAQHLTDVAEVLAACRAAATASDTILNTVGDFDAPVSQPIDGEQSECEMGGGPT